MPLPYYSDRRAKVVESEVAEVIRRQTSWSIFAAHEGACFDLRCHHACDDGLKTEAIIEVKSRSIFCRQYATIHVALKKIKFLNKKADSFNCRALFVVKFLDGIFFFEVPRDVSAFPIRMGGRFDRGDHRDQEEMIHFPSRDFKPILSLT